MAETPTSASTPAPKGVITPADPVEAKSFSEAAARPAKEAAKAAEAVSAKAAEAAAAAARANSDILHRQAETAQSAVRSGLEAGVKSFEGLTQSWTRAMGLTPSVDLAETSSRNLRAVSQASTALAKGAQDASKAWLELTQRTVRTNIEAMGQFAQARSMPELLAVQTNLVRDNLQQAIASSEEIARLSADAIREAARAIQPPTI
jgi:phasin family protein